MKTVEVHDVQAGLVDRIVVRQVLLPDAAGRPPKVAWTVDLLGVAAFDGSDPPKPKMISAFRLGITPNGDDFAVSVNARIDPELARRI